MKQIRLLPVVIAAALALLALKGLGIMTGGGYVLTGSTAVQAAGGGSSASEGGSEATMTLPVEPTITDNSPVLNDGAPTMALPGTAGHGENADHPVESEGHEEVPAPAQEAAGAEHDDAAAAEDCPATRATAAAEGHGESDDLEGFNFRTGVDDCPIDPGVNASGDALPITKDGAGNIVPLASLDGAAPSDAAILERLAERREALDALEAELGMRMALVEAAEKRIEERAEALQVLEARIEAMVDEKRALEESQFVSVVAVYETMKPKDAAAIFDKLEMPVLLRVARALTPRKMAPIMARMDPVKAKDLTAGLAVDQVEPTIDMSGGGDLAALPQIIGE